MRQTVMNEIKKPNEYRLPDFVRRGQDVNRSISTRSKIR